MSQTNTNSKVTVTADEKGNVIVASKKNSEWGHIRLQQVRPVFKDGFVSPEKLSALVVGKVDYLQTFGWYKGQELKGVIQIQESLTPFSKKEPDRDFKIAGNSGVVCKVDDEPIFRKHFYSPNPDTSDILLEHTNKDEIREAYEKVTAEVTTTAPEFNV